MDALASSEVYTTEYIYNLPDGERAELIDGQIYYMAPPSRNHQKILSALLIKIHNYIKSKGGDPCEVYPAPFAVFLNADDKTYFEPDISVICDPNKLNDKGCHGAPDWIIEIISPGSASHDYVLKLNQYLLAGVREYWIVDPQKEIVTVYFFGDTDVSPNTYNFQDKIKVNIYEDFTLDFAEFNF